MSLVKIPDNLDINITNDKELSQVEELFLEYINQDIELETITQISTLMDLYEGKFKPQYNHMGHLN